MSKHRATRRRFVAALGAATAGGLAGCSAVTGASGGGDRPGVVGETLTLTTTTSTYDTGLLAELGVRGAERTVDGRAVETRRDGSPVVTARVYTVTHCGARRTDVQDRPASGSPPAGR